MRDLVEAQQGHWQVESFRSSRSFQLVSARARCDWVCSQQLLLLAVGFGLGFLKVQVR